MMQFLSNKVILHHGDARKVLRELAAHGFDACVTDPPYALVSGDPRAVRDRLSKLPGQGRRFSERGFMGQSWDNGSVAHDVTFWRKVYRVLKPGAHLVAFGGTRTQHRIVCAIEDAGFEIRDTLMWLYGSGFPKSHNVERAINKLNGVKFAERPAEGVGFMGPDGPGGYNPTIHHLEQIGDSVPDAAQWAGWGTALKPACEPIVLARKPLSQGTVAANVLKWGTGAINIDGCRIEGTFNSTTGGMGRKASPVYGTFARQESTSIINTIGRWPANVVHDGSEEVLAGFPDVHGAGCERDAIRQADRAGIFPMPGDGHRFGDSGSAARFFYTAKADGSERIGASHPTVKPIDLMQWLIRLVTPKGGLVLDPFAGTGTTAEAAWREGCKAVLIEKEEQYCEDIARRLQISCMRERKAGSASRVRAVPNLFYETWGV